MHVEHAVQALGFLSAVIGIAALGVRWSARGCRREGAPTLMVGCCLAAMILCSDWASLHLGPGLHTLTGLWNVDDLMGHTCMIIASLALLYKVLSHFGDDTTLDALFRGRVEPILTLAAPALLLAFAASAVNRVNYLEFTDLDNLYDTAYIAYWLLLLTTVLYIQIYALYGLILIRKAKPARVVDCYILMVSVTVTVYTLFAVYVIFDAGLEHIAWSMYYLSVMLWVAVPAGSWFIKTRPMRAEKAALARLPVKPKEKA